MVFNNLVLISVVTGLNHSNIRHALSDIPDMLPYISLNCRLSFA